MCAQMPASREAVAAPSTHHVSLAADYIAWMKIGDVRADRDDLSDEFMSNHQRHRNCRLRPVVPFVDVEIGPANTGAQDANLYVVNIGLGLLHVFQPQTASSTALCKGFHSRFPPSV